MFMQDQTSFIDANIAAVTPSTAPTYDGGLLPGALVEADGGWRAVETLVAGTPVMTLDGGMKPLARIERRATSCDTAVIKISGGTLSTCSDLIMRRDQLVMLESPEAEALYGTPITLVPAHCLLGFEGVVEMGAPQGQDAVTLIFEDEEIVYANTGALVHCPGRTQASLAEMVGIRSDFFEVLRPTDAKALVAAIVAADRVMFRWAA